MSHFLNFWKIFFSMNNNKILSFMNFLSSWYQASNRLIKISPLNCDLYIYGQNNAVASVQRPQTKDNNHGNKLIFTAAYDNCVSLNLIVINSSILWSHVHFGTLLIILRNLSLIIFFLLDLIEFWFFFVFSLTK